MPKAELKVGALSAANAVIFKYIIFALEAVKHWILRLPMSVNAHTSSCEVNYSTTAKLDASACIFIL